MSIWLVGAGTMASTYAKVLSSLTNRSVTIIANTPIRSKVLAEKYGMNYFAGGLQNALKSLPIPDAAIIALPVDILAKAAYELVVAGVSKVLIEKPGCLSSDELLPIITAVKKHENFVAIAYNRRYLSSVIEARKRIKSAEKILSVNFEFCEDAPRIEALSTPLLIKEKWLLANSSHVIDLAFHLCGQPSEIRSEISGSLGWHPKGADFRGTGITNKGANFSYLADWRGPGRWGLEIILPNERLILRPIEKLSVMQRGSFEPKQIKIEDQLDKDYKPGLYLQTKAFLSDEIDATLVTLEEQFNLIKNVYNPISNY